MDKIRQGILSINESLDNTSDAVEAFAKAIMTTDTHPKWRNACAGPSSLLGVAKGSGMIEPNMATMLAYIFIDIPIKKNLLDKILLEI